MRSQHRTNPQLKGTQRYDLTTDELRMSGGLSSVTMKWEAVVSIVETKDFFLIYIGKDRAYFIPKTALASPSELDALRTLFQDQAPDRFQQEKGVVGSIARAA